VREKERKENVRTIQVNQEGFSVEILDEPSIDRASLVARVNGRILSAKIEDRVARTYRVHLGGRVLRFSLDEPRSEAQEERQVEAAGGPITVVAPMSGRVINLNVSSNAQVQVGETLVVLEAMKMQNDIAAPKGGVVKEVFVRKGALVKAGDRLCLVQ